MWAVKIVGALEKVFEQFLTPWGYAMSVLSYKQKYGQWRSVSWINAQVTAAAIATPIAGGSIEITDIIITALKTSAGTVTLTVSDGTNTETLVTLLLTNEAVRLTHAVQGRMQGWRDAVLKYTVADANSSGSLTIGYIKHSPDSSEDYSVWNSKR